jgi:hypothetical protein
MEKRKRITDEDLRMTEAMIAESYCKLKQSVVLAPSRAYQSLGQTVREHPYESAATAVGAGAAGYGMFQLVKLLNSAHESQGTIRVTIQKERRPDLLQEMMPVIIPMLTPYIASYLQKYMGGIQPGEHE